MPVLSCSRAPSSGDCRDSCRPLRKLGEIVADERKVKQVLLNLL
jgi:hypothetical protein